MNSDVKPIVAIALNVTVSDEWSGKIGFTVIDMDYYPLVLFMELLKQVKFAPIPHLNMLFVMDEGNPYCVPNVGKPSNGRKKSNVPCRLFA